MKLFVALVLAALLVVGLARCGNGFFLYGEVDRDGPVDASTFAGGIPAGLGAGPRTRAERVWIGRMNWECRRRGKRLRTPEFGSTALDVVREYRRRADEHHAPASYASEAEWVSKVDATRGEAIQDAYLAARDQDIEALLVATDAINWIARDTNPGLKKVGLRDCRSPIGYKPRSR